MATASRGPLGWIVPLIVLTGSLFGLYRLVLERVEPESTPLADEVEPTQPLRPEASAVIVELDEAGAGTSFAVVVLDSSGGGTAVLLPVNTMVEIPGFGLDPLARAIDVGGPPLAALSIANLLSLDVDHVVTVGPGDWSTLAGTAGAVTVDNPAPVEVADANGRITVLWPAGPQRLEPADVPAFLAARSLAETELDRLVRHQRFWLAFLEARRGVVGVVSDPAADSSAFLDEAASRLDDLDFRILPVTALGSRSDLYSIDAEGLDDLLATLALAEGREPEERLTVQILNGVGTPGLAVALTDRLVPAGVLVQLTGNALVFDHEVTQVVYYDDGDLRAALGIRDLLGVGEVVKQRDALDVVDVTIVIGRDLLPVLQSPVPRG